MSRNKNSAASIASLAAELSADAQTALATILKALVAGQNADSLADLADDVKPSRGSRRKAAAEKPTRRSRRAKAEAEDDEGDDDDIADIDEDEDDKPKSRRSRAKAEPAKPARSRRKAAEPDEDEDEDEAEDAVLEEATVDAIVEFMSEANVEPTAGGIRELKPIVESWGGDFDALVEDGADRREKAELAGTFIAANEAAAKALAGFDQADIDELAEELGIEPARTKKATIKAILVDINSGGGDEDEDDADEDDDEDEGDDD